MNRWYVTTFFTVIASATPGCGKSNEPVDLGNHNTRSIGAKLSDYAGVWEGYAEAYTFNDGSDAVRVTLDASGDGMIEVGQSPSLPPPDAEHNYPVDREPPIGKLISGFAYPVAQANVADERIRFTTYGTELYREWCALLTPHSYTWSSPFANGYAGAGIPDGTVLYSCSPVSVRPTSMDDDGQCRDVDEDVVIPCGPSRCASFCECTETACSLIPVDQYRSRVGLDPAVRFDGALTAGGQKLEATLLIQADDVTQGDGTRVAVRLTKQ